MLQPAPAMLAWLEALGLAYFAGSDELRRTQADALAAFGLRAHGCQYRVIRSGPHWRLREYGGPSAAPPLLIVAAPIKRPYIWDLTPSVSVVRYCLGQGLRVYLLEWIPPSGRDGNAGLDEYADQAIGECVATVAREAHGEEPFIMGHSLGGTLATIFCALEPWAAGGLVLLGAPLCFEQASSRFRDALVSIVPSTLSETDPVAGSLLSHASAAAAPDTFVWSRWADTLLSFGEPSAMDIHARVECWALDEVALPGKLVNQMLRLLYDENQFCRGTMSVRDRIIGPASVRIPTLAVVNTADEIAPSASVTPFIDQMATKDTRTIKYPGEMGVGLQHLAILVGRQSFARVWPEIISWLKARHRPKGKTRLA
jgi:polyhydroxyalkanoate synthase